MAFTFPNVGVSLFRDGSEYAEGEGVTGADGRRLRSRIATRHCSSASREPVGSQSRSFYEVFALRGIRVDRVEPGLVVCTFKVPPRLTDRAGNLANGAIANLVDVVGNSTIYYLGLPMNVSVDMSISYISTAKIDDELEIISKRTLFRNYSAPEKQSNWGDYR